MEFFVGVREGGTPSPAPETGALPRISLQTSTQIHLLSRSEERLNIYATAAVDYSWCFTKFPFGSTSNRDSLPFALTNTS
jgi:hypothetical protein